MHVCVRVHVRVWSSSLRVAITGPTLGTKFSKKVIIPGWGSTGPFIIEAQVPPHNLLRAQASRKLQELRTKQVGQLDVQHHSQHQVHQEAHPRGDEGLDAYVALDLVVHLACTWRRVMQLGQSRWGRAKAFGDGAIHRHVHAQKRESPLQRRRVGASP